jgi:hypothetical protein
VTGAQFKAGMQRLLSGEPWGFGVSPPSTSFTALSSSSSVDIFGASGDLPFAIEKGFPDPGGELWCFVLDATHRVKAAYRPTGVRFSPADGKQQGDFSCAPTW